MNLRKLFSRIVSALSALAILNEVVTPEQLNLLNTIHPKASAWIAGLGVLGLVCTEAGIKVSKVLEAVKRDKGAVPLGLLLGLTLVFGLGSSKCGGSQTVRGVAAGVAEGAKQFRAEVELAYDRGDITADESDALFAGADELREISAGVVARAADWPNLTKQQRLTLAADAVDQIGAGVERLSAKQVGVKSEKAKRDLAEHLRTARLAVSSLRVIQASLPPAAEPEPQPAPTPTPTPAPAS